MLSRLMLLAVALSVRTCLCYNILFQQLKCSLCDPILQRHVYLQSCKHIVKDCSHVYDDEKQAMVIYSENSLDC